MNEELKPGKQKNLEKTTVREDVEKYTRAAIAGLLISSASINAMGQGLERDRGEPVIEFVIPSEGGWEKMGGEYEKYNIWTSKKAREFFEKNPIHLSVGALTAAKDYFGTLRGIKIDMSSFYKSTVVIYYFNKDGRSVTSVQLYQREDGKLERREFDY